MTNTLQTNTFVGGMNLDTDVTMIPDNQYRYCLLYTSVYSVAQEDSPAVALLE